MRYVALVIIMCLASPGLAAAAVVPTGDIWYGKMDVGSRLFRFLIEPATDADGAAGHQLISLDEGNRVFRLDDFSLDDTELRFALKQTKATYSGEISEDGKTSVGSWTQSNQAFELVFRKVAAAPADLPTEAWSGTLNALFQKLTVRIRVYDESDGDDLIYFDSISQKAGGFKAMRSIEGNEWTISVAAVSGVFKGTSNDEKTEVKGTWTQNGIALDLTLTPELAISDEPVTPPNRPQTPAAPFPYTVEDVKFRNEKDGVQLAGTLTIPRTDKPCPAVVMISGSGPQDRDETLLDHKPFLVIADHLSRHGIAVLRFDDRGTGASNGNFSTATSENFANDVEAAFSFIKSDPRIAEHSIGLIGHSEGGIIAPMVAARRNDVAFAILLAGTGVNGKEILLSQGQLILRAEGVTDENLLRVQRESQLVIIDMVLNAEPDANQDELVDAAMKRLSDVLPEEALHAENLQETVAAGIQRIRSPWFHFFLTYEPATQLQKVKCPVLALNGEKDVQVDPRLNLPAIAAALEKGGNTQLMTIEFPALNHLFQTCTTGGLSEYQTIEETISPTVLRTMTEWIIDVTSVDSKK